MPLKVIIIGCGLGGALLGNGLLQNDVDFTIYESDPEETRTNKGNGKREGYQIRLGAYAVKGFKACLTDEQQHILYTQMFGRSGGVLSAAPLLYDEKLNLLLDLSKFPAYTKSAPINRVVLRDFLQAPIEAAGRVQFGKRFQRYETGPDGITAHFADGTSATCDLLIAADGSGSKINRQVGLNNIVQLEKNWGFLAKGSLPLAKLQALGPEVRRGPIAVVKDGAVLFYSAYLPKGNKDGAAGAAGAAKDDDDSFDEEMSSLFWGLLVPKERCPPNPLELEDKVGFCVDALREWDPRFEQMLRAIDNDDVYVFKPRASTNPGTTWRKTAEKKDNPDAAHPQVWLLGDAIHPMLPSRGMGANQALCDAADLLPEIVALAKKSKDGPLGRHDYTTAAAAYESRMIPRAFRWVKASGGTDETFREPSSLAGKVMLFFVARVLTVAYWISCVKSFFGYKPHDDAPELPN